MARKTKDIKIVDGRDSGKTFVITEKSALETELFFMKLLLAAGRSTNIGEIVATHGSLSALKNKDLIMEMLISIDFEIAKELIADIMSCIQFKFVINNQSDVRKLEDVDIEDVTTLTRLQKEVIDLHINFI